MRALWSNSQRKVIIVILEYLKNDDMHTKLGMRSDLNINVKIYRDFYNIFIKKQHQNPYYGIVVLQLPFSLNFMFFFPYLTKFITRRKSLAVSTPPH